MSAVHLPLATPSRPAPGAMWLASVMEPPSIILSEWVDRPDGLADVPLGVRFDVVRAVDSLGMRALEGLAKAPVPLGPVLFCQPRQTIEFLVPVGAAETWEPLRGTVCVGRGGALLCPAPGMTGRGRTWLYPPDGDGVLTDPHLLRENLLRAYARRQL
ncbi:hypothetical protein ACIRNI_13320 [Streptomyces sp. NPDC093546]|uniref:hypothetical protein n=1 Tax=Streptomyces sp. NPDC093546 TaxID=3366040 RepID=UPI00380A72BD